MSKYLHRSVFPEDFKYRIAQQHYIDDDSLLAALKEPSPISIRINTAKWNRIPVGSEKIQWCADGWYLESRPSFTLDPIFHAGCYYPQEASGMFLEQVYKQTVGNLPKIKVLDLSGAPGGKSTHLSALIRNNGLLIANEVIKSRASILAENLTRWGYSNAVVTQSDPSSFGRLPGYFDLILVDAPCSGEGMFRDQVAVNEWSLKNTALCSDRQKRILMDVWPALKEDGILIYSTCTFNPGENEENIKWLLSKHEAETIRLNISDFKGITEIDYSGIYGYGFYPGKIKGEGLFISALRKTGKQETASWRIKYDGQPKITKEEKSKALDWALFPEENLVRSGDSIISVATGIEDYNLIQKHLKIINPGTTIFTQKNKKYFPSFELALSISIRKQSFTTIGLDLAQAIAYLRRESISLSNAGKGWNLITYEDMNLGFVNNIGNRLNNNYPVEWRIRMSNLQTSNRDLIQWNRE